MLKNIKIGATIVLLIWCIASLCLLYFDAPLGAILTNDVGSQAIFSHSIGLIAIYLLSCLLSVFLGSLLYAAGDYIVSQIIIPLSMALGFLPYALSANHHSFIEVFDCYVIVSCIADLLLLARYIFVYQKVATTNRKTV